MRVNLVIAQQQQKGSELADSLEHQTHPVFIEMTRDSAVLSDPVL